MSDISERVKKIVVEHLGVEADKVTENASFIDDLGADSLDTVELVMAFEEEFGGEVVADDTFLGIIHDLNLLHSLGVHIALALRKKVVVLYGPTNGNTLWSGFGSVELVTLADVKEMQDCSDCPRRDSCEGVACEKVA